MECLQIAPRGDVWHPAHDKGGVPALVIEGSPAPREPLLLLAVPRGKGRQLDVGEVAVEGVGLHEVKEGEQLCRRGARPGGGRGLLDVLEQDVVVLQ